MMRDRDVTPVVLTLTGWLVGLWLFGWPARALAQIGSWQTHASYRSAQSVAVTPTNVYAATQNGFFYYDKADQVNRVFGKADGLHDVGISRLLYLADQKRLLIAYRSGNLDLVSLSASDEPTDILNLPTIVMAPNLTGSRAINHLYQRGNNVYLSTDFGLVVLDVVRNEIRDTYFSQRTDGSPLPILQTTATNDSLYALTAPLRTTDTARRLRAVRLAGSVNIADPANWRTVTEPGAQLESIVTNQGRLSATVNGQGIYERQNGRWLLTQSLSSPIIRQFALNAQPITATSQSVTVVGGGVFTGPLLTNPREAIADGAQLWVADGQSGLLLGAAGGFQRVAPEGPARDQFPRLYAYPNRLVALPGPQAAGNTLPANQPAADLLYVPNGRWVGVSASGLNQPFNAAVYLPAEQRLYLGSYGGGLWSQAEGQPLTLVTLPPNVNSFITRLATDGAGNLWIGTASSGGQPTLHVRRPDGQFQTITTISAGIADIVPDDNGFVWLRNDLYGGIQVVDPAQNRVRLLTTQPGEGGLLTNAVQALVKDRDGAIWVGTDLGPMVFDNPAAAFDRTISAQAPLLNRRRLLANEIVTSLVVDGGNRKWIGTRTGLYHISPNGSQLLDVFTSANSPLPSNTIQALAIEPVSGKLFIQSGTPDQPAGLVSYQGTATEPAEVLQPVTIFPNPVRPDFTGTVGIKGLTSNTTVKILDAGGTLVYETQSQGGTATWNLLDYRGRSVQTGIYLVVGVTPDGTESVVGKLAVVR